MRQETTPPVPRIRFHFIKSNYYRVIKMEGAHGGITPRGLIFAALFNERAPIPQSVTYRLEDEGPGVEMDRTTKDGLVREVEVGVMMDLNAAISFHQWLGKQIETLKGIVAKREGEDARDATNI